MPGSKPGSRHTSQDYTQQLGPTAWVATEVAPLDYTNSLNLLKNGAKVIIPPCGHLGRDTDLV
jgi:hypothetical protein